MSDVEVLDRAEIVRREVDRESTERALAVMDPTILDAIFSSRDSRKIIQRIADVSSVLMEAVDQQGLSRTFRQGDRPFLEIEAWEFLAAQLGMTIVGVDSRPLPDQSGWEATAELRHVASGRVLGRRDGMVEVSEYQGRKGGVPPGNTLRQMAQIRAARNAAKSVLAFVPRLGGFEISDPQAPATRDQVVALHTLAGKLGLDKDERHAEAGVKSFNDLTREQASELQDAWSSLVENVGEVAPSDRGGWVAPTDGGSVAPSKPAASPTNVAGVGDMAESGSAAQTGEPERPSDVEVRAAPPPESPGDQVDTLAYGEGAAASKATPGDSTQLDKLWKRAIELGLTTRKAVAFAASHGIKVKSASELTAEQMKALLAKWRERKA